tara:strand:+ start:5868 stop:6518 length:651 start_codon:yes stop_codon:yes gene_type:complete
MFENMGFKQQEKAQIRAETRERDFVKTMDTVNKGFQEEPPIDPIIENQRNDLTRWQQDMTDVIESLKHNLLNEIKIDNKWRRETMVIGYDAENKPVYHPIPPMVNHLGVARILAVVKTYLNKSNMNTNYDEEIIYRKLRRLNTALTINLGDNVKAYGIELNNLSIVKKMVLDAIEAILFSALNNGWRNYLNTTNKRVEAFTEAVQPQKRSIWGVSL